jgi:sulfite exporter TauE/SafE
MNAMFEIALSAAFLGGLAGGLHCAGMCGGIVRVLCAGPQAGGPAPRLSHLLAYNGGRIASYCVAGALAGAVGEAGLLTRAAPMLQPLMYFLASLMLVALGAYLTGLAPVVARIEGAGAWLWRRLQPLTGRLLPVTSVARATGLGALWGWLPCGMVYAVLLTALALGSAWQGAALMLAFGLGTLPNMLGIGYFYDRIERLRRAGAPRVIAGCAIAAFGVFGIVKAWHPAAVAGGGLLCYMIPGLETWFQ